ncbi:ATP-binding response regulator [Methanogenium organophilum]|uniref:Response regulator n=1 Tax=Methanogenium organophilum TaxID=2199 RepID=A0A9X9S2B4_METOG|nr:response regulator [Methanogenium organophilum]WAI00436.1 response regulator [Methanogenium organophilum]
MKILIADDKTENRYLLESALHAGGYEVISAINGYEALEVLHTTPVDMIITDILMPRMDGFQLCRLVKGDENLKKIPLIFYTASYSTADDVKFGLELGAERYILKPIDPEEFLDIIGDILHDADTTVPVKPVMEGYSDNLYLQQYSRRVFRQLETKISELEGMNDELTESQTALKESEEKFYTLFNSISESVFFHENRLENGGSRIMEVNAASCRMLGYSRDELVDLAIEDLCGSFIGKDDPGEMASLRSDGNVSFECDMKRKNGSLIPVSVKGSRVEMNGETYGLSLVRDLTAEKESRKREEEALRNIECNLTQLAILNDEIRNPLAIISGLITFEEDKISEEIRNQVTIINDIVTKLDQRWLESEKIRDFLLKHYNFMPEYRE